MVKRRPFKFWWFVLLVVAATVPRLPAVPAAFTIDDPWLVEHAESSVGLGSSLIEAWPPGVYRPLVILHFDACQAVFGSWAPGYHLVSIAVHTCVVLLVFLLSARLVGAGRPALCGALAFALLPALNEAIAWAASVGDLWASAFVIAAVMLALAAADRTGGPALWLWLFSLVAVLLGCAAKETAVVASLFVPVAAWAFGRRRPAWGWTVAYPAVVIAYLGWYASRISGPGMTSMILGNPLRCLEKTVQNLALTLVPIARNTVGDLLWGGQGPTVLLTVAVSVALGALIALALHAGDRVAVYGWLWAIVAFMPVWRLPWGERYAYLPAVGLALVVGAALTRLRTRRTTALTVAIVTVLVIFAVGSILSAAFWTLQVGRYQNRSNIAAQWKPAPNAVSSTRSPLLTRPC